VTTLHETRMRRNFTDTHKYYLRALAMLAEAAKHLPPLPDGGCSCGAQFPRVDVHQRGGVTSSRLHRIDDDHGTVPYWAVYADDYQHNNDDGLRDGAPTVECAVSVECVRCGKTYAIPNEITFY